LQQNINNLNDLLILNFNQSARWLLPICGRSFIRNWWCGQKSENIQCFGYCKPRIA